MRLSYLILSSLLLASFVGEANALQLQEVGLSDTDRFTFNNLYAGLVNSGIADAGVGGVNSNNVPVDLGRPPNPSRCVQPGCHFERVTTGSIPVDLETALRTRSPVHACSYRVTQTMSTFSDAPITVNDEAFQFDRVANVSAGQGEATRIYLSGIFADLTLSCFSITREQIVTPLTGADLAAQLSLLGVSAPPASEQVQPIQDDLKVPASGDLDNIGSGGPSQEAS